MTSLTVFGCSRDEAELFETLAPRYGVAATLTRASLSPENVALAAGRACVSVDHRTAVPRETLLALHRAGVRYVSTRSVGTDHLDLASARELGLEVGNSSYAPDGVADYTLMLILMALRGAPAQLRRVDQHDYRLGARSRELRDLTVGVVGTGRIGAAVIERLRGFGCRVLAHDPRPSGNALHVPLPQLLRHSDVVTLHAPLTASTHHLLDRVAIGQMRPGAVVVNTARGALVDTDALIDALDRGRLGAAALDVVEGEEDCYYADHAPAPGSFLARLQRLPNVVVSPHTAYYTDRALRDTVESTLLGCVEFGSAERNTACLG